MRARLASSRAAFEDCRSLLDLSWYLLLSVLFMSIAGAWFVRLLDVDLAPVSVALFAYALAYVLLSRVLDRVASLRAVVLATGLLHGAGILVLTLAWHLLGGLEARAFLFALLLPVVATGVVMRDWRPYAMALLALVAVLLVSLIESAELRWYVSLWGLPVLDWQAPAWLPPRPRPFPSAVAPPEELLVTLGLFGVFQITAAAFSESISGLVVGLSERLRATDDLLERAEGLFQAVMRADPSPSVIVYRDTAQVLDTSASFRQQFLVDPGDLPGRSLLDVVDFEDPDGVRQVLDRGQGAIGTCRYRVGPELCIAMLRVYRIDHGGASYAYLGFTVLTELYHLNSVLDGLRDPLLALDETGRLLYSNSAAATLFPEAHFGLEMAPLLATDDEPDWWRMSGAQEAEKRIHLGGQPYRVTLVGARLPGGAAWGTLVTLRSTAEEDKLYNLATHDSLTQAFNRRYFDDVLAQTAARVERGATAALAMLDLDYFKAVNDELGHEAGDEALRLFAGCVREQLRDTDVFARLGGDEFAIILASLETEVAHEVLQRVYRGLAARPLRAGGHERTLAFSAGVTAFRPGESTAALRSRADAALYAAKQAGRGRCVARD